VGELNLQDRVLFKPMLPIREIAKVMANADLAVVPKKSDSFGNEAFSTKILEFMSVGIPVTVSNTKIDQYYFNDSVVQFFNGGDPEDLARSMLLLINDPQRRESMSKNALQFVKAYNWNANKGTYLQLVDSLVDGSKVQPRGTLIEKPNCGGAQ
jgi:glycosyltransferase involved in cell wall biosynthesis